MMAESDANALRTGLNPSGNRVRWYQRKRRVPGTQMSTLQQKRLLSLQLIADDLKAHSGRRQRHNRRDIYQFGVLTGGGMKAWIDAFPTYFGEPFSGELWGFDSFEGMPEEDAALRYDRHKNDPAWLAGGLNAAEHLNLTSWPALRAKLVQNIGHLPAQTHLIRGFFNESLRGGRGFANELGMRPAFLVDIDADLYTSTREALCFLLDAGILVPGKDLQAPPLSAKIGVASLVAKKSGKVVKISRKRENGHYDKNPRKTRQTRSCVPHTARTAPRTAPHGAPWGPHSPPRGPMGRPQPLIGPHGGLNGADGPRLAPDRRQSP